jgi:CRISPR-associated endonuclease/helicase Cas3
MRECPSFRDFYRELHGWDPFPWQTRLAELVDEAGWPCEIGVPTGLGKTSTIDIAVWALAAQAGRQPAERTAPTRIWYVVDRRLLVDSASDHVTLLSERLAHGLASTASDSALAAVADRLSRIGVVARNDHPLWVSRLRGGATLGMRPPDPAQPAVICSTVAMYGSRLLFRGFGTGRGMWPVDAAHAGTDSLVLLDEAHLASALRNLFNVMGDCDAMHAGVLRAPGTFEPNPFPPLPHSRSQAVLVSLTATGDSADRFDLDDDDYGHPIVAKRLAAAKPTTLRESTTKKLAIDLATETLDRLEGLPPVAAVVFVNTPRIAGDTRSELVVLAAQRKIELDVVALTGRLRDPDAEQVRNRLLDPTSGCPSGAKPTRTRPLVVVATQTLEVGADLDFDQCVSQTAGVRAIIQRWGRLNRLGDKPHAQGVLVHPADASGEGLYRDEPAQLWDRLSTVRRSDGGVDLGPGAIASVLGDPRDQPDRIGELQPVHLWELAKTSPPPVGAAPPELFFAGFDDRTLTVTMLWRSELPDLDQGDQGGGPLTPPPAQAETIEIPLWEAREFLSKDGTDWRRVSADLTATDRPETSTLRPGDRVAVHTTSGGYGPHGWDPGETAPVLDLSPACRRSLHLTESALANLLGRPPDEEEHALLQALRLDDEDEPDPARDNKIAAEIAEALAGLDPPQHWPQGYWPFAIRPATIHLERIGDGTSAILTYHPPHDTRGLRVDALDELSVAPTVGLTEHLGAVGELAEQIATKIGLPEPLCRAVTLAARAHDLGKADQRFQRWLANTGGPPVAKSNQTKTQWQRSRQASGWPSGARHELLSVQLLQAAQHDGLHLDDPDLVAHLVISHHGHGRPTCPVAPALELESKVTYEGHNIIAPTDPSRSDWDQPDRFRRLSERHGYWGLALLEAVVRQADHLVSAATEVE